MNCEENTYEAYAPKGNQRRMYGTDEFYQRQTGVKSSAFSFGLKNEKQKEKKVWQSIFSNVFLLRSH